MRAIHQLLSAAALLTFASASLAQLPTYRVTNIVGPADAYSMWAGGLNDSGQVAGSYFSLSDSGYHAFIWDPTTGFRELDLLPGAVESVAASINNLGQVTGYNVYDDVQNERRAFLYDPLTGMQAIEPPSGTGATAGTGINDQGQVVGYTAASGCCVDPRLFVWSASTGLRDPAPSLISGFGYAINAKGRIGGSAYNGRSTEGIVISPLGVVKYVGNFPSRRKSSTVLGLNDKGDAVGQSYFETRDTFHAFIWNRTDGFRDLGLIPKADSCTAQSINNHRVVVGGCYGAFRWGSGGFRWDDVNGIVRLSDLVDAKDPLKDAIDIGVAGAINKRGQILAEAKVAGRYTLVVLTPVR